MPPADNHIKLQYDDQDYQVLKLAATIGQYPNLKAYCTQVLIAHARKLVADFQSQAAHAGMPQPEGGGP
ncbi:MAG: hypothetical protein ABGY75_16030 [Gemmataceae bacterium]